MPLEVRAFAPGRVNLIGEHTDYNGGLALPFAIAQGITVSARRRSEDAVPEQPARILTKALDLGEQDEFAVGDRAPGDWRAFVRGIAAELSRGGVAVPSAELRIAGDLPRNAGLSSSAALAVALGLALLGLAGAELDRRELARLCSRVENDWVGARTGLLDQLASLFGEPDTALYIDFASLAIEPIPLVLDGGWQIVTLDSGESHTLAAASGYNARRTECREACALLGIETLRAAQERDLQRLPNPLARRVRHVLSENDRVRATVAALRDGDLARVGALLDASHASLRDLYECSTPAVEATVSKLEQAGAAGARMVGGGFGGSVLALFPPHARPPVGARAVRPSAGARLLSE
ncbi:MAG TPA: galactokinase [Solirubrobacteraceae bacterium]|nr:galactokinase [Solirubrobacteraceae bacterium]